MSTETDLRRILATIDEGDSRAANELLPLLYGQLRRFAAKRMAEEAPSHTLQPTALVHEAYMRVVGDSGGDELRWESRGHFFAAAARAMRRILIERVRKRGAQKRGGDYQRLSLDALAPTVSDPPAELLDLDEAIDALEKLDARQAEIVNLRIYAGLTIEKAAEVSGVSKATAERDWRHAKLWLLSRLQAHDPASNEEDQA